MHITAALLVALLLPFTLASPTVEQVLTPGGYRPLSTRARRLRLTTPNTNTKTTRTDSTLRAVDRLRLVAQPRLAPISSFKTTWAVPAVPTTDHGQTIFYFNALQPNASSAILQPVLHTAPQMRGGSFWAVASWYVDGTGHAFFTTPVPTSPGVTLDAIIALTGSGLNNTSSSSSFNYTSQFAGIPGTALHISGVPELTFATETLEAYGVTASSDYPAGATVFRNIDIELVGGRAPSFAWSHEDDEGDGVVLSIERDGAVDGRIRITY
ncbi:hypothetical protein B0H13DRAFT_2086272 [Mycena leptocephala]|nr:hypothetical protein B0H13DRAFT_2086272 [Mycena leptocephala]